MEKVSETESLEAETMATELPAQSATAPPSEDDADEEEPPTPAPVPAKRGRPKGSKDAQPRTRTKPVHTPSKQYTHDDTEHHNSPATSTAPSATAELRREAPSLLHLEEAMANARQQEVDRRQNMYTSWLPY